MRMKKQILSILVLGALLLTLLPAGSFATTQAARNTAYRAAELFVREGWNVRDEYWHGYLPLGGYTDIVVTLYQGNEYAFIAGGCDDAYDVDIYLYDENGNLIDQDQTQDTAAVVAVTPRWTGTFLVRVVMYNSTPNGAHWCLVTGYR